MFFESLVASLTLSRDQVIPLTYVTSAAVADSLVALILLLDALGGKISYVVTLIIGKLLMLPFRIVRKETTKVGNNL